MGNPNSGSYIYPGSFSHGPCPSPAPCQKEDARNVESGLRNAPVLLARPVPVPGSVSKELAQNVESGLLKARKHTKPQLKRSASPKRKKEQNRKKKHVTVPRRASVHPKNGKGPGPGHGPLPCPHLKRISRILGLTCSPSYPAQLETTPRYDAAPSNAIMKLTFTGASWSAIQNQSSLLISRRDFNVSNPENAVSN